MKNMRDILLLPNFDNMDVIEKIRKDNDELYGIVPPHITIVFPFEDDMSDDELVVLSKRLSDRHFGIGSDGLITIEKSEIADFKIRIFNKDGSTAGMCGNGIRCVGRYVYDNKLTTKQIFL